MHPLLTDAVKAYKRLKGIDVLKDLNITQQRECEMMIMLGKLKADRLEQFYSKIFKAVDNKEKTPKLEGVSSFEDIINHLQGSE